MSGKFKAWLRVSPPPTTLTESSAIFKQVKSQGQIQGFRKAIQCGPAFQPPISDESTLFCATFTHEPLHLQKSFNVAVYHNLIDPKEADPYNIRGLQKRKLFPVPKTFNCVLERVEADEKRSRDARPDNPWQGPFLSRPGHWFQTVLEKTDCPPGVARGLSVVDAGQDDENMKRELNELLEESRAAGKRIKMNTLMKLWRDAVKNPAGHATNVQRPRSGTATTPPAKKTDYC